MTNAPDVGRPVILVVSPMPAMPTSAGNRRRLLATCDFLKAAGFDIDFAYVAHEDQIYRRFNQHPPTDMAAMAGYFRHLYLIEPVEPIRLKTGANGFGIDDWCPPEVDEFVRAYFAASPGTGAILVNYVWLSRALEAAPDGVLKLIDTHDRFADRKMQYQPFRAEANFFHTDATGEARGLVRADLAIAIQSAEQAYFAGIMGRPAALLLPEFAEMRPFTPPKHLRAIGFLGHGNDANLLSIGRFAGIWGQRWQPGWPKLVIAGEICRSLPADMGPGVTLLGYVDRIEAFFDAIDLVVAPIMFGTGLKMKVVEALSYGAPVVGTELAFEGIETAVPEHRLNDLDAMVDRIIALANDETSLVALCSASADVFRRYRALASTAASDLADQLRQRGTGHSGAMSAGLGSSVGQGSVGATLGSLASRGADGATLIATEFRPFTRDDPDAAAPSRLRWHLSEAVTTLPTERLAGRQVSLAPPVTAAPTTPEERRLSMRAVEALAVASPDWRGIAEGLAVTGAAIRVQFSGPSFLVKPVVPLRAFALDSDGRASEISAPVVAHVARAGHQPPSADLTPRCGDALLFTLALSGGWDHGRPGGAIVSVIIVAHALMGRIDVVTARVEGGPAR